MPLTKRRFVAGLAMAALVPLAPVGAFAEGNTIMDEMSFRMTFIFTAPDGSESPFPVAPEDVLKTVDMGPKAGLPFLAQKVEAQAAALPGFPAGNSSLIELVIREGLTGVAHGEVAIRDLPFNLADSGWSGVLSVTRPE